MLKVKLSGWRNNLAKTNPELYEQMRAIDTNMPTIEEAVKSEYWNFEAFVNSIEDLPDELHKGLEFEVIRPMRAWDNFTHRSNPEELKKAFLVNQVHLPGNELLKIRHVEVQTDLCTEALQSKLNEGWKIITVCIQPDQRRPDYILGRDFE